jgi:hypothetical protein
MFRRVADVRIARDLGAVVDEPEPDVRMEETAEEGTTESALQDAMVDLRRLKKN